MNKKWFYLIVFLFFLALAFFIPITNSEIVNSFNDSSTSKNFTGDGFWSNIAYITIPKYATITSATINLTGHSTSVPSGFAGVTVIQDMAISDTSNIAMTVDSKNETHIVVCDYTTADVFYINGSGSSWSSTTITTSSGGWYCDIEVDSNDKPHICYTNDDSADLYYANKTGSSWTSTEIAALSTLDYGGCAIDINSYDDVVVVFSTQGGTNDKILFKLYNSTTKSWSTETINTGNGINSFTLDVAFDTLDYPHVIYDLQGAASSIVYYANKTTGAWQVQTVDSSDDVGWGSLALDSNGKTHIAYKNKGETYTLKYANNSNGLTSWTSVTLDSASSDDSSIGIGVDSDNVIKIAYNNYNATGKYLRYASYQNNVWTTQTVAFSSSASYIHTDLRVKDDLSYIAGINGTTLFYSSNTASSSYPANITLRINNSVVFNNTGEFSTQNQTVNFANNITEFLAGCTAEGDGYCYLPINISGYGSKVELGSINITYSGYPRVSILSPSNYTNQSRLEINISVGSLDLDTCKYSVNNGVTNTTFTCGTNITSGISDGQFINLTVYANDTSGNSNYTKLVFSLDTLFPSVNLTYPRNSTYNAKQTIFNYTITELNPNNCWWTNNSGNKNNTVTCGTNITTDSNEGGNKWTIYINDSAGNLNSSSVSFFVDSINPNINITFPSINLSNYTITSVQVNYTVNDSNLGSCWYTRNGGVTNTSITCNTNITGVTWFQGYNNVTIYVNDTANNKNSSSISFYVDSVAPVINIVSPVDYQSFNYNANIGVNFTRSDATSSISSCWWSNDSGNHNNTLATPTDTNISVTEAGDGNYIAYVWCNDTLNNVGSDLIHYTVSLSAPSVTINYPSDNTWFQSGTNINFNVTATDDNGIRNCSLWGNWTGTWHLNQTNTTAITSGVVYPFTQTIPDSNGLKYKFGFECFDKTDTVSFSANFTFGVDEINPLINLTYPFNISYNSIQTILNYTFTETNPDTCWYSTNNGGTNTTITCGTNVTSLTASQGSNTWKVWINDSAGRVNSSAMTFFVDTVYPLISVSAPVNNSFSTNTALDLNYTITEANPDTCWYSLNNGVTNTSITCGTNLTGPWVEGVNNIFSWINDTVGNINSTHVRFTIDTTKPKVNITYPYNSSYNALQTLFNYTITETNPDTCWYSNGTGSPNVTIICGSNVTGMNSSQGGNLWFIWINDSAGNANSSNISFFVDSTYPSVDLATSFSDGDYLNYNESIEINVTASDTNLNTCFYNIDLGTNNTFTCGTNLSLNVSNGIHTVYIYANDSLNNLNGSETISFTSDTIYPIPIINSISTTINYWVFSFNSSVTETNPNNCFYSIFNSSDSIEGLFSNISISCDNTNSTSTFVSAYSTFNLFIYANDSAGNLNYTNKTFTTTQSIPSSGGGGGGIEEIIVEVPSNATFCGDGICQREGNDLGVLEDFYTCAQDCPGFNVDSAFFYCFDDDPTTLCIWEGVTAQYIGLTVGLMFAVLLATETKDKSGKRVNLARFYLRKIKK